MLTYERYSEHRDKKGYTDYKVSCICNISPTTLSEWKKGKYTPKIDKLAKIAECLEIPIEEIV